MKYNTINVKSKQPDELMDQYLTLRQGDVGWGEIRHAQALADASKYGFDEALAFLQNGADWDEIKPVDAEGPPPWAGGKNKPDKGQPPWAGGWKKGTIASSSW